MGNMKLDFKEYANTYAGKPREVMVPKQFRRILPACVACFLFFIFLFNGFGGLHTNLLARSEMHFPRKIWQTWKVDPLGFEERDHNLARTWTEKNPGFRYEVLTDQNDLAYVERYFGADGINRLDIVYTYRQLTARIIKADLLRYLIMYVEGGVYTDIDVEDLRPISRFVPERYDERDIDMVVGVEIDQPEFSNHTILGQKCKSFVQWTFMTKPRLPVMLHLVENILTWLKGVADEQRVGIADVKLDFDQVISGTGPSAFTNAIMADMSKRTGKQVTWDQFHGIDESKLIGGVLVLPVDSFAAGQGHSDSGNHDTKHALIRHHYHASKWPAAHPRYHHPIVGEVEECNWNQECVDKWDADKAAFDALTPEEQAKQIAVKEAMRIEEEQQRVAAEEAARQAEQAAPPPPPQQGGGLVQT